MDEALLAEVDAHVRLAPAPESKEEEISRLESHIGQLEKLLKKGGAVGRKLDFLIQEFMREANTIGSKCNDATVAHDVVELKTHIERLREQAQNVE